MGLRVSLLAMTSILGSCAEPEPSREPAGGSLGGGPGSGGSPTQSTGSGGTGGILQPSDATTYDQCRFPGFAGAIAVSCDYVSIEFSQPLPAASLTAEVTTSTGDHLVSTTDPTDFFSPVLNVDLNAAGTEALGLFIRGVAGYYLSGGSPQAPPESISVTVREADAIVAESQISLTYSCVALREYQSHWCWMAKPETLVVTTSQ